MKIAFICAFNGNQNTGMVSVDAAIPSLIGRLPEEARPQVRLFCTELAQTFGDIPGWGRVDYALLDKPIKQLAGFDRIVFWGDFLHAKRYHVLDHRLRQIRAGLTAEEAKESGYRRLLLEDAPDEMLQRVVVFGGSMFHNRLMEEDKRYAAAIGRLFRHAALVQMRDPVSAALVQRLSGFTRSDTQGMDCAFLLDSDDVFAWTGTAPPEPTRKVIGYSFGRSPNPELMLALTRRIAEMQDAEIGNIHWLDGRFASPLQKLAERLSRVRQSSLVITDTYHCAMNAWREGVPAICIGEGSNRAAMSLADKKKELAYQMLGLMDHYVYSEMLSGPGGVTHVADTLAKPLRRSAAPRVTQAIDGWTRQAEAKLIQALGLAASPAAARA